jgi:hypothetical protein
MSAGKLLATLLVFAVTGLAEVTTNETHSIWFGLRDLWRTCDWEKILA